MTSGSASIQAAGRSRTESDMQHFASATLGDPRRPSATWVFVTIDSSNPLLQRGSQ
jgi:hypothetical protein